MAEPQAKLLAPPLVFGRRPFAHDVANFWGAKSNERLYVCCCGAFCAPCVYARAFEVLHGGYKDCCPCLPAWWPDVWPRSLLGCGACENWPVLAAYAATHAEGEPPKTTTAEICMYWWIALLPCFYCHGCQIAAELKQAAPPAKALFT